MKSKHHSASKKPLPRQKPKTPSVSETLTPSEIERLQQSAKDANDFFKKAFASEKH